MRTSVFYTMSQAERRGRLKCSSWPDLDWENEWVMLTTSDDFDRAIAMDSRSGKLQEAFGLPYGGPYDVETKDGIRLEDEEDAEEYLRQIKEDANVTRLPTKEQIDKWSDKCLSKSMR